MGVRCEKVDQIRFHQLQRKGFRFPPECSGNAARAPFLHKTVKDGRVFANFPVPLRMGDDGDISVQLQFIKQPFSVGT